MLVNSSLKKLESVPMNTILLRTDGFKKVFKGLTYKNSSSKIVNYHSGTYTSIGKRTPAKEHHLAKEYLGLEEGHNKQFRRTQTAKEGLRIRDNEDR